MSHDYDVLLPGGYYCDLIFTGLPELPRLGADLFGTGFDMVPGACFYTALALHRLGLRVGWACDFGDDCYSRFVLDAAAREGIDDRLFRLHARPLRRVSVSFSFAHDRGFISYKDEFASPSPIPIIERYRPRCLLLSYLHVGPQLHTLAATTHAYGGLVYMDCQARPETLADPQVVAAIRAVDIFAPNREEARRRSRWRWRGWLSWCRWPLSSSAPRARSPGAATRWRMRRASRSRWSTPPARATASTPASCMATCAAWR